MKYQDTRTGAKTKIQPCRTPTPSYHPSKVAAIPKMQHTSPTSAGLGWRAALITVTSRCITVAFAGSGGLRALFATCGTGRNDSRMFFVVDDNLQCPETTRPVLCGR